MTCHVCANPTCVDECQPKVSAVKAEPALNCWPTAETRYREAIQALIYAVEHPNSDQNFAVAAGRRALDQKLSAEEVSKLRATIRASKRTLAQLRCSFGQNTVGHQEASLMIHECQCVLGQ